MSTNKNNSYISAGTPAIEGQEGLFNRVWYRFFDIVSRKIAILDGTQSTTATAGAAGALPALPAGYITIIDQSGVARKVPYYNA